MDVILIPGLWLDASSWDDVLPALRDAGLRPRPLTMPGLGAPASDSADVGIADWVQAVVDEIDEPTRRRTAPTAQSVPARVPTDPISLRDERRYRVPVTVLSGAFDDGGFRAFLQQWGPYADEFGAIEESEIVRLGTGHWPQFSEPQRLGAAIVAAITRR